MRFALFSARVSIFIYFHFRFVWILLLLLLLQQLLLVFAQLFARVKFFALVLLVVVAPFAELLLLLFFFVVNASPFAANTNCVNRSNKCCHRRRLPSFYSPPPTLFRCMQYSHCALITLSLLLCRSMAAKSFCDCTIIVTVNLGEHFRHELQSSFTLPRFLLPGGTHAPASAPTAAPASPRNAVATWPKPSFSLSPALSLCLHI